jgi:hypothetical protein
METKIIIWRNNETKNYFFKNRNKIDWPLAKHPKKREETQINRIRGKKWNATTNQWNLNDPLANTLKTYILINLDKLVDE